MTDHNQPSRHPVAVTVFCDADGMDRRDAHIVAEQAIAEALGRDIHTRTYQGHPRSARVVRVLATGAAFVNGLLLVQPNPSVYRTTTPDQDSE